MASIGSYAYVVVMSKPWKYVSNDVWCVECGCVVLLYSGNFSLADSAAIAKPLGACEFVTLPGASGGCFQWQGKVAYMHLCVMRSVI